MCTMTWFVKEGGYELFFNRDERISRRHAEPPTIKLTGGIACISPTDADAGGSWITTNHFGITACLLNHYQFQQLSTYKQWTSRGEIVRRFATTRNLDFVERHFNELDLGDYRAFRMFLIDRLGNNRLCVWDGHQPRVEFNVSSPKSSSSVSAKQVKTTRKQLFSKLALSESKDSAEFIKFHASHMPNKSQESVCMHRSDANTVSLSHVDVNSEVVKFSYADGAPCEAQLGKSLQISVVVDSERPPLAAPWVLAAARR